MGLSKRLFNIIRSNIGYYARKPTLAYDSMRHKIGEDHEPETGGDYSEAGSTDRRDIYRQAYRLLEIPYGSDPEEIRAAHRRLLQKYHPDRFARDGQSLENATRLAQELGAAKERLLEGFKLGHL